MRELGEKMCKHCGNKSDISLCNKCWMELSAKACWNEGASKNEMFSGQYTEILGMLHELTVKINNLELQLNLAKRLNV